MVKMKFINNEKEMISKEKIQKYILTEWINNRDERMKIVNYESAVKVTVEFEDGYKTVATMNNIKLGKVKNIFSKSVCGVGYIGKGKYCSNHKSKSYWMRMLHRCYDEKVHKERPTYKGCLVDECWHNYQVFAKWFDDNYTDGFVLDKDILIKNNRIYSPETCCFVPQEINGLFTKTNAKRGKYPIGVKKEGDRFRADMSYKKNSTYLGAFDTPEEAFQAYKTAKEVLIKKVADKWKEQISNKVYKAMYNYQVEITD